MILGWSEYPGNPRILRQREVSYVCRRSINTPIGGVGGEQRPSRDDLDVVECLGNPKILRQGEWVDCVHPRMMLGWPECPENPRILRQVK